MQDKNTLGAPTEGLGQNVTFAFNPINGTPQLSAPGAAGVRNDVIGSPVAGGLQLAQPSQERISNGTLDILLQAGNKALATQIERKRTEQFVAGMQRVMAGEAVVDIVKSQPWYSQVFGDTAVVEGARQYAQQANVIEAAAKVEADMPKVRELAGAEAQRYFTDLVQSSMTGDAATDVATMQSFARTLPAVMRRQVKEHYAWKQEQAAQQQTRAVMSMAGRIQALGGAYATEFVTAPEHAQLREELLNLTRPADGENEQAWQKRTTDQLRAMGAGGQLHALNAFLDAGIMDVLPPESVAQIKTARDAGEARARREYEDAWGNDLIELYAKAAHPSQGADTKELLAQVDMLNEKFKRTTGATNGLITGDARRALATRSIDAIVTAEKAGLAKAERAREKAATVAEKQQVEAGIDAEVVSAASTGRLHRLDLSQDRKDAALVPVLDSLPPEKRFDVLARAHVASGHVVKPIAQDLQSNVRRMLAGPKLDESMLMPVYQQWLGLYQRDPATAQAYYGEHAQALGRFHKTFTSTGSAPAALAAFSERPAKGELNKEVIKETLSVTRDAFNFYFDSLRPTVTDLRTGQAEIVGQLIGRDIEESVGTWGTKVGTKVAIEAAHRAGKFEVAAGYVIQKDPSQKSLAEFLTRPSAYTGRDLGVKPFGSDENASNLLGAAIDTALYGDPRQDKAGVIPQNNLFGRTADAVRVYRIDDRGGIPQFWVHAVSGGESFHIPISGDSLFLLRDQAKSQDVKQGGFKFGFSMTPGVEAFNKR